MLIAGPVYSILYWQHRQMTRCSSGGVVRFTACDLGCERERTQWMGRWWVSTTTFDRKTTKRAFPTARKRESHQQRVCLLEVQARQLTPALQLAAGDDRIHVWRSGGMDIFWLRLLTGQHVLPPNTHVRSSPVYSIQPCHLPTVAADLAAHTLRASASYGRVIISCHWC